MTGLEIPDTWQFSWEKKPYGIMGIEWDNHRTNLAVFRQAMFDQRVASLGFPGSLECLEIAIALWLLVISDKHQLIQLIDDTLW